MAQCGCNRLPASTPLRPMRLEAQALRRAAPRHGHLQASRCCMQRTESRCAPLTGAASRLQVVASERSKASKAQYAQRQMAGSRQASPLWGLSVNAPEHLRAHGSS